MIKKKDIEDIISKYYTFYLIISNLVKEEHLFPYHYQENFFDRQVAVKVMKEGIKEKIKEKTDMNVICEVMGSIYVLIKNDKKDILLKYTEDNNFYACVDLLDRDELTLNKFNKDEFIDYDIHKKELTYMGETIEIKQEALEDFELLLDQIKEMIDI